MNQIKFSHDSYDKFRRLEILPDKVTLLQVFVINNSELSNAFVRYDTLFWDNENNENFFELPKGKLLVLLFQTDLIRSGGDLFTTIRRHTQEKEKYYKKLEGEDFKVVIV